MILFLLCFTALVCCLLLAYRLHPYHQRIKKTEKMLKRYLLLRQKKDMPENEAWTQAASFYLNLKGWNEKKILEMKVTLEDAYFDFKERRDVIFTEKSVAVELARRTLILEGSQGSSEMGLQDIEKVYEVVEKAARKVFPLK